MQTRSQGAMWPKMLPNPKEFETWPPKESETVHRLTWTTLNWLAACGILQLILLPVQAHRSCLAYPHDYPQTETKWVERISEVIRQRKLPLEWKETSKDGNQEMFLLDTKCNRQMENSEVKVDRRGLQSRRVKCQFDREGRILQGE